LFWNQHDSSNSRTFLGCSNLVLTSSFDWTVKLWNPKIKKESLISFESAEDYIYDVSWNRANPYLFSSVDGEGYIDLWDLSKDLEIPHVHHKADSSAINKAMWSRDGSKLLTGNSQCALKDYVLHRNILKTTNEALERFENNIFNLVKK